MQQLYIEQCQRNEVELISDSLEEMGAVSVILTDQFDDPILEPAPGEIPLWPNVVIQALYEDKTDAEHAIQHLTQTYPHLIFRLEDLPEQDWERVCLENFKPQQFGTRLWVCPSWLTPPDPNAVNLILDPGLAFGTGTHPTTSLCLTWLEQAELTHKNLIDYGCGSGILALAALKLGAAHVNAVDIDEQALLATQNNAFNNDLSATQLTVGHPETLTKKTDLIIANILLTPLMALGTRFHELLNNEGQLVVSGLLASQTNELIQAYASIFTFELTMIEEDWALLVFKPTT